MSDETVTILQKLSLPWGREVEVQDVAYESGMNIVRLRFREGRHRFTIIDVDPANARALAALLGAWAENKPD